MITLSSKIVPVLYCIVLYCIGFTYHILIKPVNNITVSTHLMYMNVETLPTLSTEGDNMTRGRQSNKDRML